MTPDIAFHLMAKLLSSALIVAGPILAAVLAVGVLVSILQVVTSIQESTLTFVPKLVVAITALLLCGSWMLHKIMAFAVSLWAGIPDMF